MSRLHPASLDSSSPSVCLIVPGGAEAQRSRTLTAVAAQSRPVDEAAAPSAAGQGARLSGGLELRRSGEATWLWLLEPGAVPSPTALEELLAPLRSPGHLPAPALVASRLVDGAGQFERSLAPWPRLTEKDTAVTAAEHGLVSIRAARSGSLLVARKAVEAYGLPSARYEAWGQDIEWTARMLKAESGYLAPRSTVMMPAHGALLEASSGRGFRAWHSAAGMLLRGAWSGEERAWYALALARELRSPDRSTP